MSRVKNISLDGTLLEIGSGVEKFETVAEMKAYADAENGMICYCIASDKYYSYLSTNTDEIDTGKWKIFNNYIIDDTDDVGADDMTYSSSKINELIGTGDGELSADIISNVEVGGIPANTTLLTGTSFTTLFTQLLVKYLSPIVSFVLNPNTTIYEYGDEISSIDLVATATKRSNNIANIKYYVGDTVVDTKDEISNPGISLGGSYTYTYTTPITNTTTFKMSISDGTSIVESDVKTISFVNAMYKGLGSDVTLTKIVQKKGNYTYGGITCTNDTVIFKYPSSYGNLRSIKDSNNFENIGAFSKTTETIGSVEYNVYTSGAATLNNFSYTFSF